MEEEKYVSGYCRQLDGARVVEVILCNGQLEDVDCSYGSCVHESGCPIAKEVKALLPEAGNR